MNCIQAQIEIATPGEGLAGRLRSYMATRHILRCPDCSEFAKAARRLEAQAHQLATAPAPEHLRSRIATALSAQLNQRTASNVVADSEVRQDIIAARERKDITMRLQIAIAAAVGVLVVMSVFVPEQGAHAIKDMQRALTRVRSAHLLCYGYNSEGLFMLADEDWYQDGMWRKQGDSGTRIIDQGIWYKYDAVHHKLISDEDAGGQWDVFALGSLEADFQNGQNAQGKEEDIGETTVNGHVAQEVSYTRAGDFLGTSYLDLYRLEDEFASTNLNHEPSKRLMEHRYPLRLRLQYALS